VPCSVCRLEGIREPVASPATIGSCLSGGHDIWWELEAATQEDALGRLPRYVAERTKVIRVSEVRVP